MPALGQFLGSSAGLSAPVITRLTETWKTEQRSFAARDLSGVDYVYLWADGIHVNIRLEEHKLPCRYSSGNTSVIFGVLRHQGGRIAEENRQGSPVSGSVRRSLTRGAMIRRRPRRAAAGS